MLLPLQAWRTLLLVLTMAVSQLLMVRGGAHRLLLMRFDGVELWRSYMLQRCQQRGQLWSRLHIWASFDGRTCSPLGRMGRL